MNKSMFYGTVTIGEKGQIVIPVQARKELNLHPGDKLLAIKAPMQNGIVLIKEDMLRTMLQHMQESFQEIFTSETKDA